jgi:ERF superfamily
MSETKTIAGALAKAQAEMGKAVKDSENPHFKSMYADLSSVVDACFPALNKHGIAVFQPIRRDESGLTVETVFLHESGEILSCAVPLLVNKNDMQGLGSAITYARRYGLMCMAGIAPEDDDGNAAAAAKPMVDDRRGPSDEEIAYTKAVTNALVTIASAESLGDLAAVWKALPSSVGNDPSVLRATNGRKRELTPPKQDDGDEIPYEGKS